MIDLTNVADLTAALAQALRNKGKGRDYDNPPNGVLVECVLRTQSTIHHVVSLQEGAKASLCEYTNNRGNIRQGVVENPQKEGPSLVVWAVDPRKGCLYRVGPIKRGKITLLEGDSIAVVNKRVGHIGVGRGRYIRIVDRHGRIRDFKSRGAYTTYLYGPMQHRAKLRKPRLSIWRGDRDTAGEYSGIGGLTYDEQGGLTLATEANRQRKVCPLCGTECCHDSAVCYNDDCTHIFYTEGGGFLMGGKYIPGKHEAPEFAPAPLLDQKDRILPLPSNWEQTGKTTAKIMG